MAACLRTSCLTVFSHIVTGILPSVPRNLVSFKAFTFSWTMTADVGVYLSPPAAAVVGADGVAPLLGAPRVPVLGPAVVTIVPVVPTAASTAGFPLVP
eukprot:jgi/Phyca11/505567/fgenesh2_kg.PHYCAscaffold_14_\